MIIVDGPDGSGKTTLIKELGIPVAPRFADSLTGPKPKLGHLVRNDMNQWSRSKCKVYDRHPFISDYVYGPIMRDGVDKTLLTLDREYYRYFLEKSLVIMCRPPLPIAMSNLHEGDQLPGLKQQYEQIYRAYQNMEILLLEAGAEVVPYDFTIPPLALVAKQFAQNHEKRWNA